MPSNHGPPSKNLDPQIGCTSELNICSMHLQHLQAVWHRNRYYPMPRVHNLLSFASGDALAFSFSLTCKQLAFLLGCQVEGRSILPFGVFLEMSAAAVATCTAAASPIQEVLLQSATQYGMCELPSSDLAQHQVVCATSTNGQMNVATSNASGQRHYYNALFGTSAAINEHCTCILEASGGSPVTKVGSWS